MRQEGVGATSFRGRPAASFADFPPANAGAYFPPATPALPWPPCVELPPLGVVGALAPPVELPEFMPVVPSLLIEPLFIESLSIVLLDMPGLSMLLDCGAGQPAFLGFRGEVVRMAAWRRRGAEHKKSVASEKWDSIVSDTTDNFVSANNFIRAGYRLFEPQVPWAWAHSLYWRKQLR